MDQQAHKKPLLLSLISGLILLIIERVFELLPDQFYDALFSIAGPKGLVQMCLLLIFLVIAIPVLSKTIPLKRNLLKTKISKQSKFLTYLKYQGFYWEIYQNGKNKLEVSQNPYCINDGVLLKINHKQSIYADYMCPNCHDENGYREFKLYELESNIQHILDSQGLSFFDKSDIKKTIP